MSSQVETGIQQDPGVAEMSTQVEAEVREEGAELTAIADAVTHTATEQPAEHTKGGMPQLDFDTFSSQIFWLVVTFAALYVLLARSVIPRIHDVLEHRQNKITHDIDRAEQLRNEAEEAREVYERALKESRAKAQALISESAALMDKSSAVRHAELDAKLTKQLAEAESNILNAKTQALSKLAPVSKELTQQIVEKLTGQKPKDTEVAPVVDNLLKGSANG